MPIGNLTGSYGSTTAATVVPHAFEDVPDQHVAMYQVYLADQLLFGNRQPLAAAFGLWEALARVTVLTSARGAGCRFGGSGGQQCG